VPVVTVGYEAHPITSMGGLRVLPDIALTDLVPEETRLLLLPGGDAWLEADPPEQLGSQLRAFETHAVPIAGICAQCAPGYQSPGLYVEALAVRDRGVISASGLVPPKAGTPQTVVFGPDGQRVGEVRGMGGAQQADRWLRRLGFTPE